MQKSQKNQWNILIKDGSKEFCVQVFKYLFVIAIGFFVYLDSVQQNGFSNENGIVGKGNRNENTELALTASLKSDMKMYSSHSVHSLTCSLLTLWQYNQCGTTGKSNQCSTSLLTLPGHLLSKTRPDSNWGSPLRHGCFLKPGIFFITRFSSNSMNLEISSSSVCVFKTVLLSGKFVGDGAS